MKYPTNGIIPISQNIFNRIYSARPMLKEILTTNVIKALLETVFAKQMDYLTSSTDPTTTSVTRDGIMSVGVMRNYYAEQTVGDSKLKYDVYSPLGTVVRTMCKTYFLNKADEILYINNFIANSTSYNEAFQILSVQQEENKYKLAAKTGNVLCEPASIFINIIVAKDRQETKNTDIYWFIYPFTHFKSEWIHQTLIGSVGRVAVPIVAGSFLDWIKGLDIMTKPYYYIDNLKNEAIAYIFDIEKTDSNDKVWTQINKIHEQVSGTKAYLADSIILMSGFTYRITTEILQAMIMISLTRAAYKGIEENLKEVGPWQTSMSLAKILTVSVITYKTSVMVATNYFIDISESNSLEELIVDLNADINVVPGTTKIEYTLINSSSDENNKNESFSVGDLIASNFSPKYFNNINTTISSLISNKIANECELVYEWYGDFVGEENTCKLDNNDYMEL